jgi:hypothetical protein
VRTTLDIADDVLVAAKEIARRERKTAGQVLSELARQALDQPTPAAGRSVPDHVEPREFLGFRPFSTRGGTVTNEIIDRLREDDPC